MKRTRNTLAPLVSALALTLAALPPATAAESGESSTRAANPCSGNPCGGSKRRRASAENPCSGNPCGGSKRRRATAENPCSGKSR